MSATPSKWAFLFLLGLGLASTGSRAAEPSEYQVKAAFLYKFADYVEWPQNALGPNSAFTICVVGRDPFAKAIDDIVQGQQSGGRPLAVKRLDQLVPASGCQIAYVAAASSQDQAGALRAGMADHILTVTDNAAADAKGIVNFVIKDNRVRFEIDDEQAARSSIKISSKLLTLAVAIRSRSTGGTR